MTEPSITLARAARGDVTAFMAMERDPGAAPFVLADSRTDHLARLDDPDAVVLRIVHGGAIAGFIVLVLDRDGASVELRRIVVRTRERGIGRRAIEHMHALCRDELGRRRVWLDVFDDNQRARHVYECLGYRRCGTRELNGRRLDCYELQL